MVDLSILHIKRRPASGVVNCLSLRRFSIGTLDPLCLHESESNYTIGTPCFLGYRDRQCLRFSKAHLHSNWSNTQSSSLHGLRSRRLKDLLVSQAERSVGLTS
ncbi:hypothetical protein HBI56_197720 [Parastagonospora nodorum]|uniref:Uncharacterized protein n=1 Tax=Phaeosphaeria nodorum (strain SN15 / ATCC MYA-4574 / FGSC 10173) TaxID=321614 RepID=A0A7U2I538_PHANO|nr:hypothetical protein HBH56_209680 [Parastagonospora nodorum]QRC99717.1 hypothetical protein JI435_309190 [Parastagonospora nodorum SN15]KAH3923533.1 hypothetical protein HBH54_208550 [Parastagonospora nodorum]KAH3941595.1 hypothetical protein HBH53_198280 [Parastagonospora nodorum]KAH3960405.1 hypothetical protein HBH51_193060 [Parastagonospora nodorum]